VLLVLPVFGLLDRIDALLIVSPVLYMYAVWWR
jgi:CDP-diglyceride synthetase